MKSYRFRREKIYRRRRAFIIAVVIALLAVGSYFLFHGDDDQSNTVIDTPVPETPETGLPQAPDTTPGASQEPTPTPTPEPAGTYTESHGFLPAIGSLEPSGKTDELKKLVEDFVSRQSGRYGVTFIDLATGESFGVNDKEEYIAASTSKLPMVLLLYTKIESGEVDPDMLLEYKESDLEYGTGIIQNSPFGTKYTVRETAELSIRKSDNCGINMIIDLLGIENIRQYIVDLGGVVYYDKRHRSCPYDMALVARELYRRYLENPVVYEKLIEDLENTDWHDRIDASLPKDVRVAHKIGNQTRTANDVGIVFASHPYVLSVMTGDVDFGTACNKIAELSRMIYDFVEEYATAPAE
jgi:hypothetical protein